MRIYVGIIIMFAAITSFANDRLEFFQGKLFSDSQVDDAWGIAYEKDIRSPFSAGYYYINEGDIERNKRDGIAGVINYHLPLMSNSLTLIIGAGPYFYADTQIEGQSYSDDFGLGAIINTALRYKLSNTPLYFEAAAKEIIVPQSRSTHLLTLGMGINFDYKNNQAQNQEQQNSLSLLYGESILNSVNDESGASYLAEYQYQSPRYQHLGIAFGLLHETSQQVNLNVNGTLNRNDYYTQAKWNSRLNQHLGISIGLGPSYIINNNEGHNGYVGVITSTTIELPLNKSTIVLVRWSRTFTFQNADTDNYMIGFSYHF